MHCAVTYYVLLIITIIVVGGGAGAVTRVQRGSSLDSRTPRQTLTDLASSYMSTDTRRYPITTCHDMLIILFYCLVVQVIISCTVAIWCALHLLTRLRITWPTIWQWPPQKPTTATRISTARRLHSWWEMTTLPHPTVPLVCLRWGSYWILTLTHSTLIQSTMQTNHVHCMNCHQEVSRLQRSRRHWAWDGVRQIWRSWSGDLFSSSTSRCVI
jgi:hypothetical protein